MAEKDKDYYLGLIPSQNRVQPKFTALVGAVLDLCIDASDCVGTLDESFDFDIAVGAQLDSIGDVLGLPRTLPFDPPAGYGPSMDDSDYRTALKLKRMMNRLDGLRSSWVDQVLEILPYAEVTIVDNQDMTIDVSVLGTMPAVIQMFFDNNYFMPRSQGVLTNRTVSTDPIFAYDMNTDEYKGYDEGRWT